MDVAAFMNSYSAEGEGEKTIAVMKEDVAKRLHLAAAIEQVICAKRAAAAAVRDGALGLTRNNIPAAGDPAV